MTATFNFSLLSRRRIRLVHQANTSESGLACLAMAANYYSSSVDYGTLRRLFPPSLRGCLISNLIEIADHVGLVARATRLKPEHIGALHFPAVVEWNRGYAVVEAVRGSKVLVHDPAGDSGWHRIDNIAHCLGDMGIEIRPGNNFAQVEVPRRIKLSQIWGRVTGLKRTIAQTIALSIVMQAFVIASPYYMQISIDQVLPAFDLDLLAVLAIGFGLFTLVNTIASLLRSVVLLSAGASIGFGISTNIARRLFRLPTAWFDKRHVGDVLSRFQSVTPIQQSLTQGAISALIDGSLAVVTLAIMFFYSSALALVAVVAFALYAAVRFITFAAQRRVQETAIVAAGKEQSTMIETLRGIVTLRLFNAESARHALWQSRLVDAVAAIVSLGRLGAWQAAANTVILGLENVIAIWLAVRLAIDGGFSIGMIFAYFAYKQQFIQKASSLIDQVISFSLIGLHLERLSDIALSEEDECFRAPQADSRALKGQIELRNIGFRYSPTDPWVLKGVNMRVDVGEHVAITGASGGGKSTLVKIMLGLLEPEEGEILIDNVPLAQFGRRNYRNQIAAVLQNDNLFSGSLAENIALFDPLPDRDLLQRSVQTAALDEDIAELPMGFDTLVGDMGSALSGGQRQRLLIARALYRQPQLLVMDESTSHLDNSREQVVTAAIATLGITRIVIAHRNETLLAASRIYLLTNGQLSESKENISGHAAPNGSRDENGAAAK